jgi:hypothetical protein
VHLQHNLCTENRPQQQSRIEFAPMRSRDRSQTVARRSLLLCGVQEKKKKNY